MKNVHDFEYGKDCIIFYVIDKNHDTEIKDVALYSNTFGDWIYLKLDQLTDRQQAKLENALEDHLANLIIEKEWNYDDFY